LVAVEALALGGEHLLDLDDQPGAGEHLMRVGRDLGARGPVLLIRKAGARLDEDTMAANRNWPTIEGTRPTRYSLSLISLGTPIRSSPLSTIAGSAHRY
jgi:hypothetical protein